MKLKNNNNEISDISGGLSPGGYAELWKVAYPLIITSATHTVMQFIDRKFLAMNATSDVAAALPGGILSFTMFTFFMITAGFTAAIVSQNYGRKNWKNCARVPWAGFYFALGSGLICSFLLSWVGLTIITFGQHSPEVLSGELEYFRMLIPSGGFIFISSAFCSFFSGRGKTWTVAIVHFIASMVNIVLDYMLIFGKWGAPQMGIAGAGLATTIACVVGAVVAFVYFILQDQKKYPTRKDWHYNHVDMRFLIKFGTPAGMQVFFSVGAFTVIVFLIGRIGSIELAATTIALSINMLTFMPLLGISEATGILAGKYVGAKQCEISEKVAYKAWKLSSAYMVLMGVFYIFFPEVLLEFFAPEKGDEAVKFAEVIRIGRIILLFAAVYNLFNVLRFVFMGALRGAGDTKVPMWMIIATSWIILAPGGYLIIAVWKLDIVVVWIFLTCYSGLVGGLFLWRFKSGAWKNIDMLDKGPQGPTEPPLIEVLDFEADGPHA